MIEKGKNENVESIYNYKDNKGETIWTPNPTLAFARAEFYGTDRVSVLSYEVPPLPEKPKKDLTD